MNQSFQTELNTCLQSHNLNQALDLFQSNPDKLKDLPHLRTYIALLLETGKIDAAEKHNKDLASLATHDVAHYFFQASIAEGRGDLNEALLNYKIAFYINPNQALPAARIKTLVAKLGLQQQHHTDAKIAFCTGGYFYENKFNANTVSERAIGGSESSFIHLTRELSRLGKKIDVYCNCDKPGTYEGVTYRSIHEFATMHAINQYDTVVGFRLADAFLGNLNPNAKHYFWLQDDVETELYRHFKPQNYRIDRYIVLGPFHKQRWQSHFGLNDEQLLLTKNGYDQELFEPAATRENKIIFASRPERGLEQAILVYKKIKESRPDFKLSLCTYTQKKSFADDPEFQKVAHLLDDDGIEFLGSMPKHEFAQKLKHCKYLIHPNRIKNIENACVAAIEAQASGVPVICSRGGAMAETVQHGQTGIVVDDDGQDEILIQRMAEAILSLEANPDQYQHLSAGARDWSTTHYAWDQIAKQWLEWL